MHLKQRYVMQWLMGLGLVLVAATLRIGFWWIQARSGAVQPGDPEEYYRSAVHLLHGGYYDTGKWLRPPLYPAFLTIMFLPGIDIARALLGQALACSVGVLAFAWLAGQLFGSQKIAMMSGVSAALFIPLASFSSVMFAEGLFVILVAMALALLDRTITGMHTGTAFACGVMFALAALMRAVSLSFIPLAALLVWSLPSNRRRSVVLAGLLLLGATLTIAPWTARNYLVHERLILIDTNGGISMWYGTVQSDEDKRRGEARLAAVANLADRQSLALQMTRERIQADPLNFLTRMRYKVASLFLLQMRSFAVGDIITISPQGEHVVLGAGENPFWITLIADVQYIGLMFLGIAGLCFAPDRRRMLPSLLWIIFCILLSALTIGHPRLRLPIVSVMLPWAAFTLLGLPAVWNARYRLVRDRRTLMALLGCLLFLGLIFSTRYLTWLRGERYAIGGRQALAQGDLASAQQAFEQARAADATNALRLIELADLALAQGDFATASTLYGQALTLEDRNLYAHAMRIQTAELLSIPSQAHAEIAALAGYGRDNNEIYSWAWRAFRSPPPAQLQPGDPMALGHYQGFAPPTFDLPSGRWTLGHGQLRLKGDHGTLYLKLRGPPGRQVHISLEDAPRKYTLPLNGEIQTISIPIESLCDCPPRAATVVHLCSETALLDLERAPWPVGVAVLEGRIEPYKNNRKIGAIYDRIKRAHDYVLVKRRRP